MRRVTEARNIRFIAALLISGALWAGALLSGLTDGKSGTAATVSKKTDLGDSLVLAQYNPCPGGKCPTPP